jgi:hypothetical protein
MLYLQSKILHELWKTIKIKAKLQEMGKKYEWKLKDIVLRTDRPILKVDCVFEDDTEFPSYGEKENE